MRYYVVSDIHGFYSELIEALQNANYFNDSKPHKLIILGDFFDRGKEAVKMQKFLCELIDNNECILIRGNHEDLIMEFANNIYKYYPNITESHHFRNSTVDTVCQLLNISIIDFMLQPEYYCNLIKETPLFKKIIPSSINYFETKKYIFTHGYIPCEFDKTKDVYKYIRRWKKVKDEKWNEARWINGMKANNDGVREKKTIICGHWHCSYGHSHYEHKGEEFGESADYSPYYGKGIIAIDGCVPRTFKINCIVLED